MTFSIANLPEPALIEELNYEAIFRQLVEDFQARHPDYSALLESDPAIKLLQVFAYRELILRQRVNDAFKATLLAFAQTGDLDNLAAFYGVERQTAEPDDDLRSRTIERIKGSSTAGGAAWYRYQALTSDSRVADALVTSPVAGQVRVAVLSEEGKSIRLAVGDALDAIGALYELPRLANLGEDDDTYRARLRQAVLGSAGEGTASTDLLAIVDERMQADDVRVVTDVVEVVTANIVEVPITAAIYLYPDTPASVLDGLADRLRSDLDAEGGLGWNLSRSWLVSRMHLAGVQRVELASPATDIDIDDTSAVAFGAITITLAGYDR